MGEKDYYDSIQTWLAKEKNCTPTGEDFKLCKLELLTADVIASKENLRYVCEVKNYPYPVGSQGWGSVGQALALRREADFIYVGCIASDDDSVNNSWRRATATRTVQKLLSYIGVSSPRDFEEYCNVLRAVFRCFFGDLGIGLLVVRELLNKEPHERDLHVIEIMEPKQTNRRLSNSACS